MSSLRIGIVIQARMTSTRLPGKVLLPLGEKSVLEHVVDRCRSSKLATHVIVACPTGAESSPIEALCNLMHWDMISGSEHDVLSRYMDAARAFNLDLIVRVTSDCPLLDPDVVDGVISLLLQSKNSAQPFDYTSNVMPNRTYPRGLDVECFTRIALERAFSEATDPLDREHVTRYIYRSGTFKLGCLEASNDSSAYRLTLDTPEDYAALQALCRYLSPTTAKLPEILSTLQQHPEIVRLNSHVAQKHS